MLKSKATSLARAGESVTYIFMGGSGKTEAVMSIANKLNFDQYTNITVLSHQDLKEKYRQENYWRPWTPSPLSLLKFYIEREKPKHVMVDEVPLETGNMFQLFGIRYLVLGFGITMIIFYLLIIQNKWIN